MMKKHPTLKIKHSPVREGGKLKIKKYWYPKALTILFLLIGTAIILFPVKETPVLEQVQFVWNTAQLEGLHGSATDQRDYLFNDTTGTTTPTTTPTITTTTIQTQPTYTGQLYTGQLVVTGALPATGQLPTTTGTTITTGQIITGTIPANTGTFSVITGTNPQAPTLGTSGSGTTILINAMQQSINQMLGITGAILPSIQTGIVEIQTGKECRTPRGDTLQHKDFVLAYQQRGDVNTICNVERRICVDGVLEGSYAKESCKEDVTYNYQKAEVISYNEKIIDPFVQPGEPSNAGGSFSSQGKLNETLKPTTVAGTTNKPVIADKPAVNQTTVTKSNCTSPRGSTIKHGQFVKAYKSSLGLIDVPCETQLRMCINGNLKGSFVNKACVFKNMTYNDYIAGNTDITVPTSQDIQGTPTPPATNADNNALFDRVRSIFGR